jgi:putative tryptophan/tyrosine transport system substrate-binding protein
VLAHPATPSTRIQLEGAKIAAPRLRIELQPIRSVDGPADFEVAFKAMRGADGVLVLDSPFVTTHRTRGVKLASAHRLPAMYGFRELVDVGGLMSYGAKIPDLYRRAARYVDKIFKGAKPADLPIEQPDTFELVIDRTTAKALRLTIPQSVLVRADRIVE